MLIRTGNQKLGYYVPAGIRIGASWKKFIVIIIITFHVSRFTFHGSRFA
jgi:hypothetical protein